MSRRLASTFFVVAAIFALSVVLSFANQMWLQYPEGYDTPGHQSRAQYLLDSWPNIDWGYLWYQGIPMYRWYGPLPTWITVLVAKMTGWSVALALTVVLVASIGMTGALVSLLSLRLTQNALASALAGVIVVSASSIWNWAKIGGMYPKVISISFLCLSLLLLVRYLYDDESGIRRKILLLGVELSLVLAVISHPFIGLAAIVSTLALSVSRNGFRGLLTAFKLLIPAGLMAAWFVIPFFSPPPPGAIVLKETQRRTFVESLGFRFGIAADVLMTLASLPFLPISYINLGYSTLASLAILLISGALIRGRLPQANSNENPRQPPGARVFLALYVAFALLAVLTLDYIFLVFNVILVAVTGAFLLNRALAFLLPKRGLMARRLPVIVAIVLVVSINLFQTPSWSNPVFAERSYFGEDVVSRLLANADTSAPYRIAVPDDAIASWLNYRFKVPQTRGYSGEGQLNTDWVVWFENKVWRTGSEMETQFMLDWYGVKWIISHPPYEFKKFQQQTRLFKLIASNTFPIYGFEYAQASPILSPTNAPAVLIISKSVYDNIFFALALSNSNSQKVISVRGAAYLEDYSVKELAQFDAIFLYGYDFRDRAKAHELLLTYVRDGGRVIIDTGFSPEATASALPEPYPVTETKATNFGTKWALTTANHPIASGLDTSLFSPAIYGKSDPWGLSASSNSSVRPWASPVLWNAGHPVLVAGQYGKGRIVWLGFNLAYHALSYSNLTESFLILALISWAAGDIKPLAPTADYVGRRANAHYAEVAVGRGATGVLFKENIFPNWHAYFLEGTTSVPLRIYEAGPGFMYVRIPTGKSSEKVAFQYERSPLEWVSMFIAIATGASLVLQVARSRTRLGQSE